MSLMLRWLCVLVTAVPSVAAPLHVAAAPTQDLPEVAPEPPTETPPSTTDAIHEQMVKSFVEHFQQGELQYNRGAYALAAAQFEQAFAAVPAEAALRNVSLSHERAGDDVAAAIAARRYLELPGCDTPGIDRALCGSHRAELEAALERLLDRVAELRLEIAEGVELREIRINNRVTAREDFPILVAAGRVDIELSGGGSGQKRQRVIEVRAGEKQTIIVDSFDAAPRIPETRLPPSGKPRARGKWVRPAFWTGVGLTAASGAALAVTGALTLVHKSRYERQQELFNENPPPVDDMGNVGDPEFPYPAAEKRRYLRYQDVSNVLVGVTSALAVVTVVLAVVTYTRPRNTGTSRASTRTRVRYAGTGLVVNW
jgi:hypothetical protein